MSSLILVVDDDPVQRRLLEQALKRFGHDPYLTDSGEAALAALSGPAAGAAAIVLDLVMPGIGGIEVLETLRERGFDTPVIVQTAQGSIDTVIGAMRAGAFDFVVKPVAPERLRLSLASALKVNSRATEAGRTRKVSSPSLRDIVTRSPTMDRVLRLAQKAAASTIPILIEGESGTGKELVARAIQAASDRRSRPFVTVNCGAIPANLIESILFGHEKGSFTGATERHAGKFVEAHTGTLFLDEIGDLPMEAQVKLLRAVQEGEVDPVGGKSTVKVDIRLISATHQNLMKKVEQGLFREDLYYRLNVFPITVPPLRQRSEDIPILVDHFMRKLAPQGRAAAARTISPEALSLLAAYDWPGNIRQLENAMFRAMVLADGPILTTGEFPQIVAQVDGPDLAPGSRPPQPIVAPALATQPAEGAPAMPPPRIETRPFGVLKALDERGNVRPLADIESEMIRLAIEHYDGQMSEVARRLGIGRSTLYRKLKDYSIDPELRGARVNGP